MATRTINTKYRKSVPSVENHSPRDGRDGDGEEDSPRDCSVEAGESWLADGSELSDGDDDDWPGLDSDGSLPFFASLRLGSGPEDDGCSERVFGSGALESLPFDCDCDCDAG